MVEESSLAARIGARLRGLRQARGLTLAKLAEQSGVSVSYLSAVEKGVNLPSLQTLASVTEALGVSIPAVLAEEGQTHVQIGRVPEQATATVDTSHPLLQLRTAILHASAGDHGDSPVPTENHDVFVFVQHGQISLSLAGGDYLSATATRSMPRTPARSAGGPTISASLCGRRAHHGSGECAKSGSAASGPRNPVRGRRSKRVMFLLARTGTYTSGCERGLCGADGLLLGCCEGDGVDVVTVRPA